MLNTIKYFFVYIFIFQHIHAEELFVDTSKLSLAHITFSHKYCKQKSPEHTLCKSKALSYIDYDDPDLPTFLKGIKEILSPTIENYQKNDLKVSTLADIKDYNSNISAEWEECSVIELFAKTPTTYTLSTSSYGYSGGAHGYYNVAYKNYSIATQKALTLDDIFINDYNKTLINIAKRHYKRIYNLQPKDPLTHDGWFDDKFVLAENIAITSQGLYFYYNSYEIKPYVAGQTAFLLPYSALYSIINPKGILGFVLQDKKTFHATFVDKEKARIELHTHINPDKTITLTAKIDKLTYENRGWFSLSFPQLKNTKNILKHGYKGFQNLYIYPKGSKVYHQTQEKAVISRYLLAEAEDPKWNYDTNHSITIILKVPTSQKELIVDVRAIFKSKQKTITIPDEYDGIKGQQGFSNYRVFIGL